ncbi:hypothetical protein ACFSTC_00265 [Nonomuraea ferruginea]
MTAEVTRLVVGLPVCVVGVLLLADRYARRRGALVLAAGVVWIVPPAMSDVLAAVEHPGTPVAAAAILLAAAGTACQPLTVLLFPLCLLPRPAVRWPRTAVIVTAAAASIQYAVVWGLGTPGSARFASPWAEHRARHVGRRPAARQPGRARLAGAGRDGGGDRRAGPRGVEGGAGERGPVGDRRGLPALRLPPAFRPVG